MKKYLYCSPLLLALIGLAFAALARKLKVKEKFPGTSGEVPDIITDLVGLTFVPMALFWRSGLSLDKTNGNGLMIPGRNGDRPNGGMIEIEEARRSIS